MNHRYNDEELKEKYGIRDMGGIALDAPQELGYRCPKGHADLFWSEFIDHIWCYQCKMDYHYAQDCVLTEDHCLSELPQQPRIIKGAKTWFEDGNGLPNIPEEMLCDLEKDSSTT